MTSRQLRHLTTSLDASEPYDVVIIGSGPAGTILGRSLVERGIRTLILESGSNLFRWFTDRRLRHLARYEFSGNTEYPLTNTRARMLGGTSNFWTGRCTRFQVSDFEPNPYTPEGNPWPITYDELEPYYERAENSLKVRGDEFSEYIPPRKNRLPASPGQGISAIRSLLADAAVAVDSSPTSEPENGFRFFRVQNEILPGFLSSPHGTLVTGANVTRLIPDGEGRIAEAEVRTLDGVRKSARGKIFVVACGGIETPRLLLHSRSPEFPHGIGNGNDLVGRGFNDHPAVNFYASVRHARNPLSPFGTIARSHQFYDAFRPEGLGSVLLVFRQAWFFPNHNLPLLGLVKLSNLPKAIVHSVSRMITPTLYIGATIEMRVSDSNRVVLSDRVKDCFGNPLAQLDFDYTEEDLRTLERARELIRGIYRKLGATDVEEIEGSWSRHHQSTCRMGDDPGRSVVDRNLRVHESPNLYLCGSEVFTTGGAMQPCLTIAGLSHRLADHLASKFGNSPGAVRTPGWVQA
ncbi:MAG: GMC oxidoreductase [Deltaproteobacteria bacterium]|nr:GMC family oxidoreductase [Candidatus Deferrimicrobiaceae bacterium]